MDSLQSVFGKRLRHLRTVREMTQEQLGKVAGIDYKHIGGIERGENVPSFEAIEKLAVGLGVDFYELFLPEHIAGPPNAQKLDVLISSIQKNGSEEMKAFLVQVLAAAESLNWK